MVNLRYNIVLFTKIFTRFLQSFQIGKIFNRNTSVTVLNFCVLPAVFMEFDHFINISILRLINSVITKIIG